MEECQRKTQCPSKLYPLPQPRAPSMCTNPKSSSALKCFSLPLQQEDLKKFPLTSELRLEQTKLFREQLLLNFINTCINKSDKNCGGCLLWRRASYLSLYWQQIPSQLILRRYPETNEKLGKFLLLSSQISEQPRKTAMLYKNHPCWKQGSCP